MGCGFITGSRWAIGGALSLLASVGACDDDARPCRSTATSSLPGVTISFPGATCDFSLAQAPAGVQLTYELAVDQRMTEISPRAQDTGSCGAPGDSGLIVFAQVVGGSERY